MVAVPLKKKKQTYDTHGAASDLRCVPRAAHTLPSASPSQDSSPSPRYKHIKEAPDGRGLNHRQLGEIRGAVRYEFLRAGFNDVDQSSPVDSAQGTAPEIAPSDYVDAAMDSAARLGYLYGVRGMKGGERYE